MWSDEVDGLACHLHRPMAHSSLSRGQGLPIRHRLVLSQQSSVVLVEIREASRAL
jgi:hypothetical protein